MTENNIITVKNEMTLDNVQAQKTVQIKRIEGGCGIRQRLNQLGLHVGDKIKIKKAGRFGGPMLVDFNQLHIAIGQGMARKIIVDIV